jgi:hypothetical protein
MMATRRFKVIRVVRGKVIDSIHLDSDDYLEIDIRFQDGTSLSIQITPRMEIELVTCWAGRRGTASLSGVCCDENPVPVGLITSSHPVRFSWSLCCLPSHTKTKAVVSASFPTSLLFGVRRLAAARTVPRSKRRFRAKRD